jgi:hypothetical protein
MVLSRGVLALRRNPRTNPLRLAGARARGVARGVAPATSQLAPWDHSAFGHHHSRLARRRGRRRPRVCRASSRHPLPSAADSRASTSASYGPAPPRGCDEQASRAVQGARGEQGARGASRGVGGRGLRTYPRALSSDPATAIINEESDDRHRGAARSGGWATGRAPHGGTPPSLTPNPKKIPTQACRQSRSSCLLLCALWLWPQWSTCPSLICLSRSDPSPLL